MVLHLWFHHYHNCFNMVPWWNQIHAGTAELKELELDEATNLLLSIFVSHYVVLPSQCPTGIEFWSKCLLFDHWTVVGHTDAAFVLTFFFVCIFTTRYCFASHHFPLSSLCPCEVIICRPIALASLYFVCLFFFCFCHCVIISKWKLQWRHSFWCLEKLKTLVIIG